MVKLQALGSVAFASLPLHQLAKGPKQSGEGPFIQSCHLQFGLGRVRTLGCTDGGRSWSSAEQGKFYCIDLAEHSLQRSIINVPPK